MTDYPALVASLHASLQSWRKVGAFLEACGARRDGSYWQLVTLPEGDKRRIKPGYYERGAIAGAWAMELPAPDPVSAVQLYGIEHVQKCHPEPDTAVLMRTEGHALLEVNAKHNGKMIWETAIEPQGSVSLLTPPKKKRKRRDDSSVPLVSDIVALPPNSFKTRLGLTGNLERISAVAKAAVQALEERG